MVLGSRYRSDVYHHKVKTALNNAKRDYGLNLYKKQHILESFILNLPVSIQESIKSPDIIIEGFIDAGMLDGVSKSMPSFEGILNTMSIQMKDDEKQVLINKFNYYHELQLKYGQLTVNDHLNGGLAKGEDDSLRSSNAEHLQYCKTLNHEHQNLLRKRKLLEINIEAEKKSNEQIQRNKDQLELNKQCTNVIKYEYNALHNAHEVNDSFTMENVPFQCFFDQNKPQRQPNTKQLKGFLISRVLPKVPKQIPTKIIPNLKPILAEKCYDNRCKPILLNIQPVENTTAIAVEQSASIISSSVSNKDRNCEKYLNNIEWRKNICMTIKGVKRMEYEENIPSTIVDDANCVLSEVEIRFEEHFIKTNTESKKNHWAFQWAKQNLPSIVSAQAYFNHLRNGISDLAFSRDACLLNQPIHGTFIDARKEETKKLVGNYLYYDNIKLCWIRSGFVCGQTTNFGSRDTQHSNDSKKPSGSALMFHKKYADKNIRTDVKEGNFQDLKQYCGLAFDRDECNGLTFNDSNSILGWDDDTMAQLKKLAVNGKRIEEVQLVMAAYLFEFSSALCIGGNNVSQSASFESIAHTFH